MKIIIIFYEIKIKLSKKKKIKQGIKKINMNNFEIRPEFLRIPTEGD